MLYPDIRLAGLCDFGQESLTSFHAHVYIHKYTLSRSQEPGLQDPDYDRVNEGLEELLKSVPLGFQFDVNSPPATNILAARLYAKYLQICTNTYSPFIRRFLESKDHRNLSDDPNLMKAAEKGIDTLIQNTKAFHGLGGQRLIVTDVWVIAYR
jgi:hypothetical protein